ncbi:MAG: sensor histidine kinase [Bacteroidota bacterium]
MESANFRKYVLLGQLSFWVILFLINFIEQLEYESPTSAFLFGLSSIGYLIPTVYIHYYCLLPLFFSGKRWIYFPATFLLITVFILLYGFIDTFIPSNYPESIDEIGEGFVYYFLLSLIITAAFSLIYFVEAWHENFKKEALLKSEKLQTELNFLKSQINPHFLFNTLNNIYAFAQTGNEKTAPMLERLSAILRFMVYDCGAERVGLLKEIAAIEDLLEIHKMKNSKQQNIQLMHQGVKGYHLIAPLILVNFVENACKHSDTISNPNGFIKINLSVGESDNCQFKIVNTFKEKNSITSKYEGVGLTNIKKRLALQYGEDYSFSERKEGSVYTLKLEIPLERKQ